MSKSLVLVLSDTIDIVNKVQSCLNDCEVVHCHNDEECTCFLQQNASHVRLVFIHKYEYDLDVITLVRTFKNMNGSYEIVVFSMWSELFEIVDIVKSGAFDFFVSETDFDRLDAVLSRSLAHQFSDFNGAQNGQLADSLETSLSNIVLDLDIMFESESQFSDSFLRIVSLYKDWKGRGLKSYAQPSVLIVEDEPDCNDMFYEMLSVHFKAYSVFDGASCIEILKSDVFDVVLLDLFLPDISGSELVVQFLEHNPMTKIVVVSAFDVTKEVVDVMRSGATYFLNKPVLKSDLIGTINQVWLEGCTEKVLSVAESEFYQKCLSDEQKLHVLEELYLFYRSQERDLRLIDICFFYPEIKKFNIPDSFLLPQNITKETLREFIESMKAIDISFST